MFVRCSNCQTQFSLDDRQVGPDGVAVRCSVCRYVFRVEPPPGSEPVLWQVQTVDGEAFSADDLSVMRDWIREGRLHPDDTISRTGKHWIRLGDMPEFSDAFAGFPDLPAVLNPREGEPGNTDDIAALGPPPSFGGGNELESSTDAMELVQHEASQRIDLSGLLELSDTEDTVARSVTPDEVPTVVGSGPVESTTVYAPPESGPEPVPEPGAPTRGPGSMFDEDSASMVLDDLVAPRDAQQAGASFVAKRRPKHRTTKVRTVSAEISTDAQGSGVVRVLDGSRGDAEELEELDDEIDVVEVSEPGDDPVPSTSSGAMRAVEGRSMLGAVTAHVKPITTPSEVAVVPPPPEPPPMAAPHDTASAILEVDPARRRASWPLFAGLGLLCGAAVIFGIPPIRARVMAMAGIVAGDEGQEAPAELVAADEAVRGGVQAELEAAATGVKTRLADEAVVGSTRADLGLAAVEVAAAQAVGLRLQSVLEGEGSDARYRAEDRAEAAAQSFAGIDVAVADPERLARTRARLRLAQGRPEDEVLPLVPASEVELRALVSAASMWKSGRTRVPSGVISTLSEVSEPSLSAQIVLAMAYERGGDDVAAAEVRKALQTRAADDPGVVALLEGAGEGTAAATVASATDNPSGAEPKNPTAVGASGQGAEPEETIVIKDSPKGMSVDKLIERGCDKVEHGDVGGGLKMLLRAFDKRPADIDVLVCLGLAHRKKGTAGTALRYYEKALARSPRFLPALLGGARSATKLKNDDKALTLYRRALAVAPGNAEAKSFIAKHEAGSEQPKPQPKPEPPTAPEQPAPAEPAPEN